MISSLHGSRPRLRCISPRRLSVPLLSVCRGSVLIGIFSWILKLPTLIKYKGAVPGFLVALTPYSLVIGTILITIFSLLVFGGTTYAIFIMYPGVEAGNRRRNIDATLPYAINYVTSMSTAGITPAEVFRLLGDSPIYGESSR